MTAGPIVMSHNQAQYRALAQNKIKNPKIKSKSPK